MDQSVQDLVRGVVKLLGNRNASFAAMSERTKNNFIREKTLIGWFLKKQRQYSSDEQWSDNSKVEEKKR